MKKGGSNIKSNYFIHLIYAGSFLLSVFVVISYLIWNKHDTVLQNKIETEQQLALKTEQEQAKKVKILNCLIQARNIYSENWATACKEHAKSIHVALDNCIKGSEKSARFISGDGSLVDYNALYQSYVAQCKSYYGVPNFNSNCSLPNSMAKSIDERLQKDEKLCMILS